MQLTEENIIASLAKEGLTATHQKEHQQVFAVMTINGHEYPLFVRKLSEGNLVQIIAFVPCSIAEGALPDVCRLLHMLNKELDMPGFCCDEESKTVFYRVVQPCPQQVVNEELLLAYVSTIKRVCTMFGTVIQAVAIKAMGLEEMLKKAKEMSVKSAPTVMKA